MPAQSEHRRRIHVRARALARQRPGVRVPGRASALAALILAAASCAHPDPVYTQNAPRPSLSQVLGSLFGEQDPAERRLWAHQPEDEPWLEASCPASNNPRLADTPRLELAWPVAALGINSLYGRRAHPLINRMRFHYGVDLEAMAGDPVAAPAEGVVRDAGWRGGHGFRLVIEHHDGYVTVCSHLSAIHVRAGEPVERGEVVGLVGSSGSSTGPHLHLEVTHRGVHVDPLAVLGARPVTTGRAPRS